MTDGQGNQEKNTEGIKKNVDREAPTTEEPDEGMQRMARTQDNTPSTGGSSTDHSVGSTAGSENSSTTTPGSSGDSSTSEGKPKEAQKDVEKSTDQTVVKKDGGGGDGKEPGQGDGATGGQAGAK